MVAVRRLPRERLRLRHRILSQRPPIIVRAALGSSRDDRKTFCIPDRWPVLHPPPVSRAEIDADERGPPRTHRYAPPVRLRPSGPPRAVIASPRPSCRWPRPERSPAARTLNPVLIAVQVCRSWSSCRAVHADQRITTARRRRITRAAPAGRDLDLGRPEAAAVFVLAPLRPRFFPRGTIPGVQADVLRDQCVVRVPRGLIVEGRRQAVECLPMRNRWSARERIGAGLGAGCGGDDRGTGAVATGRHRATSRAPRRLPPGCRAERRFNAGEDPGTASGSLVACGSS